MSINRYAARTDANQSAIVDALRAAGASVWVCAGGCGKTERRPPSKMQKLMCAPCRLASYAGTGNPNYSNAAEKRCMLCGGHFKSYNKTRMYCSQRCYHLTRPAVPSKCPAPTNPRKPAYCPKPPKESAKLTANCKHCGAGFVRYQSSRKKYCGYACHLASGGALRSGLAAARATMRYGAKKDANHGPIVEALQAYGVSVIDTSHVGCGFPDLVLGWAKETLMMEIKNPKTSYGRKGLNKNQLRWKEDWNGGPYAVVSTVDGALAAVKALEARGVPVATMEAA